MKPQIDRFRKDIEALGQIGRTPEGGVSRFSLSPEDLQGRNLVMSLMRDAGLLVRVDAIGNIRARREGRDPSLPLVMMGSHIDTVPNGGDFDGPTGVMGALEVVRTLNDNNITTKHPIEVVVFADEEGTRFEKGTLGSASMAGELKVEDLWNLADSRGITLKDALKTAEAAGSPDDVLLKKGEVKAFVELHVEQGSKLEEMNIPIGVVEAITGLCHLKITVSGKADHAGATPMNRRADALVPATQMIQEVERIGRSEPEHSLVTTVGYLEVHPGAMNIVPERAVFIVDVRDTSAATLDGAIEEIKSTIARIAQERKVEYRIEELEYVPAVDLSPTVRKDISDACDKLGIEWVDIPSRAGHDTTYMALAADAGMIFVPSVAGKSHTPEEVTHWEDIRVGLDVLYEVTLSLAGT